MAADPKDAAKDAGGRVGSRGEPVVHGVCEAALEELVRVGFLALRIDDVAARAGVHKTTIYRRWPTKLDLVRDTLLNFMETRTPPLPSSGSFRDDLTELARGMSQFFGSMLGQGLMRVMMSEGTDPELGTLCQQIRGAKESAGRAWVKEAVDRGEVDPSIDAELLFGTLVGSIHNKLFSRNQRVDDLFIGRLVDLLLLGTAPRKKATKGKRNKS